VAERSPAPPRKREFSRGTLFVGLLLVAVAGAGAAFGLGRLRGGPDSGRVIYANERGVFVRELATAKQERLTTVPKDTLSVWPDPTGRWMAYLRRDGDLWMIDLDSGDRWRISERLSVGLGWSPDGRFVAGELLSDRDLVAVDPGSRGNRLLVSKYSGGRIVWRDRDHFFTVIGKDFVSIQLSGRRPLASKVADDAVPLAVSPEGAEVLYMIGPEGTRPRLAIARLNGNRPIGRRIVFDGWAKLAASSPQGFLAFSARDRSDRNGTWVLDATTKPARRVTAAAEQLAWSRDGSSLVYLVNGSLFARDLADGRSRRLSAHGTYVKGFAVVP
jgi:hypothetical protein